MEKKEESSNLDLTNFNNDSSSHLNNIENFYDDKIEEKKESSEKEDNFKFISFISKNEPMDDFSDFSNDLKTFLEKKNIKKYSRDEIKKINILKKSYFRFIPTDEKMNEIFNFCNYIPVIKIEGNKILFHDGKENGKYLYLNELINLINNNKLLITNDENDKKEIINNAYICKLHKKNNFKYCTNCKLHICEDKQCLINHKEHKLIGQNKNIKTIIKTIQKKANKTIISINHNFIKKYFEYNCINIIYCFIIKKIIREKIIMDRQNKFNYNIEKNIIDAININKKQNIKNPLDKFKIEKQKKENTIKYLGILWITEFYSKEQIKNNINQNKNIWISVCSNNFLIIYLFNLFKDAEKYDIKKDFIEIQRKNIDIYRPQFIKRLEGCFNPNDKNNNYFLIGSFNRYDSILISVSLDYKTIEEIQKINSKDLMYSLEINHYNNKYLLQNNNRFFKIWGYGDIPDKINKFKNGLKYKIIYSNIKKEELKTFLMCENNSIINNNNIISFIENKKLLIVLHYCSESYLRFYKIEETEELNINIIGELKPRKDQNQFLNVINNCCIINNKYLIITAKANIKYGGFYIINLDTIKIIYYYSEKKSTFFNSVINFQGNMFICNSEFNLKNNIKQEYKKKNKLFLYEFIEKENEKFKIEKKSTFEGGLSLIICSSLISDYFFLTNNKNTNKNSLIKIYDNKIILCLYYKNIMEKKEKKDEIRELIKIK